MAGKKDPGAGPDSLTIETEFRGELRQLQWTGKEATSLHSHADFARTIAGAYDLPPAWSATLVAYTNKADERSVLASDEQLKEVLALAQEKQATGKLLRIRIDRVGLALTETMQSAPAGDRKRRQAAVARRQPAGPGGGRRGHLPVYTNRMGERVTMKREVKTLAHSANSNLASWTTLRPGTDGWLKWQSSVKKTLTDTPELQQHAKYIVPPRSSKKEHAYVLLPSAGCFYCFPFESDGRRYALLGRPEPGGNSPEQQVPAALLATLKQLGPEVCTPEAEKELAARVAEIEKERAEHVARMSSANGQRDHSPEEIQSRRKELMAKEEARQRKDWAKQVQGMRDHKSFTTLLPGGTMLMAMDITLLVVDDAQCLLASRPRLDNPTEDAAMSNMEIRSLLNDIMVVCPFDVLATMQLAADTERAYERQQALLNELAEEDDKTAEKKSPKQSKSRKKKGKKKNQQRAESDGDVTEFRPASARALFQSSDDSDEHDLEIAEPLSVTKEATSDATSTSTDGTDDGLTQELERAIAAADEDERHKDTEANGWTVVTSPTKSKGNAAATAQGRKPSSKGKKQSRKGKASSAVTPRTTRRGKAEAEAGNAPAKQTRDAREKSTRRKRKPLEPESPAVVEPTSPEKQPDPPALPDGEVEWPQLGEPNAETDHSSALASVEALLGRSSESSDSGGHVAAEQVNDMMTSLAAEKLDMATRFPATPGEVGNEQASEEAEPAYESPCLPAWGVTSVPSEAGGLGPLGEAAPQAEGVQTFNVAFTVQGTGTISMAADTGQAAIEQLQYLTSMPGGLSDLMRFAKCMTMFEVTSSEPAFLVSADVAGLLTPNALASDCGVK
eukprot:COSAG04_NODE_2170_length_4638_cov_2.626790_2_plen_846_part_00